MLALLLAATLAQSPEAPLQLRLRGFDPVPQRAARASLRVPPEALALAPTSPEIAHLSSVLTTSVGVLMMIGFTLNAALQPVPPLGPLIGGNVLGFLLMNVGPSVGDLLNGDLGRAGSRVLGRIGMLLLIPLTLVLGPVAPIAALGLLSTWCASAGIDLMDARGAPARWVGRQPGKERTPPPGWAAGS